MLWIKAFHVIAMVTWFAGLFYLPRLFIYHLQAETEAEHLRFCTMERKLYGIMAIGMGLTWIFGVWMVAVNTGFLSLHWLQVKVAIVFALSGYSGWLGASRRRFAARQNRHSDRFWRIANEVPAVALIAVVILVIVRPF
jgi:protoporphyrinogen IX oxidase